MVIDKEKNVYEAKIYRYRILKWLSITNKITVVAGQTGVFECASDLLNFPGNINVDATNGTVYVVDRINNRIQKWHQDATAGITVAELSNTTEGNDAASLNEPFGVLVDDKTGVIYIVDSFNNRIQHCRM